MAQNPSLILGLFTPTAWQEVIAMSKVFHDGNPTLEDAAKARDFDPEQKRLLESLVAALHPGCRRDAQMASEAVDAARTVYYKDRGDDNDYHRRDSEIDALGVIEMQLRDCLAMAGSISRDLNDLSLAVCKAGADLEGIAVPVMAGKTAFSPIEVDADDSDGTITYMRQSMTIRSLVSMAREAKKQRAELQDDEYPALRQALERFAEALDTWVATAVQRIVDGRA